MGKNTTLSVVLWCDTALFAFLLNVQIIRTLSVASMTKITIKFLNFRMPENFAVIYLKIRQRGQTLGYFVKKMQME